MAPVPSRGVVARGRRFLTLTGPPTPGSRMKRVCSTFILMAAIILFVASLHSSWLPFIYPASMVLVAGVVVAGALVSFPGGRTRPRRGPSGESPGKHLPAVRRDLLYRDALLGDDHGVRRLVASPGRLTASGAVEGLAIASRVAAPAGARAGIPGGVWQTMPSPWSLVRSRMGANPDTTLRLGCAPPHPPWVDCSRNLQMRREGPGR